MRVLAVIGGELAGYERGGEWSVLSTLVAANGPESIQVRVLALVVTERPSIVFGSPLGRAAWGTGGGPAPRTSHDAGESARQRLGRALSYLRGLGLRADGAIEDADAYGAVRREAVRGGYDRVLVLVPERGRVRRLVGRDLATRLRRALAVPVDGPVGPPGD